MPLMFRSFVPYTIPGVLALVGCCWWWYTSWKKTQITSHYSEEGQDMGLLASPTAVSTESSHLPTGDEQVPATQRQDQTTDKQEPDTKGVASTVSSGVEPAKAELPKHDDISAVPIAEYVQVDLVKDSLCSAKDDFSSTTTTAVDQCAQSALEHPLGPESSMVSTSFPFSASKPVSDASVESKHNENGDFSQPADTSNNMEELQRMAAGLITEVISMAQQEVMVVSSRKSFEASSSSTPTFYVKETTRDEDLHESHVGYPSQSHTDDIQQQAAQIVKEVITGCLTLSVWEKAENEQECLVPSQGQLESTLVLPKLQAEEAITGTEDSGCRMFHWQCKKAQISHDSEERQAVSLLALPSEGSNKMVDTGCLAASFTYGRSHMADTEQRPAEQKTLVQVHAPAVKTSAGEPVCLPVVMMGSPSCSSTTTDSQQGSPETIRQNPPVPTSAPSNVVEKCSLHDRPEAAAVSTESSHLPTGDELDSTMQPQDQTTDKQELDTKEVALTVSSGVELAKAECPDPEVELAGDILAVPFAENVQMDSLSFIKDDLPFTTTTAVDQCAQSVLGHSLGPESPIVLASFPLSASTPVSDNSVKPQHHENGDFIWSAETSNNTEYLQRLATGVMVVRSSKTSEAVSPSKPTFYGKETLRDADLHASHVRASSQSHTDYIQQQAAQIIKEVINGCLTSSVWEKAEDEQGRLVSSQGQLEPTSVLPKLQAEEAIAETEDSGCSTCQSEDGISSEDLLLSIGLSSAVPESKEDHIQASEISRYSSEKEDGLQESSDLTGVEEPTLTREHVTPVCEAARLNGTGLSAEADHSVASDVDSMDSVDNCSTLGTGNGQQSCSQASLSQSSELIVWEIEVPKHLVGRLIGKRRWFVRFLKQSSGAEVYIINLPYTQEFGICHIKGTQQQVDKALALISKKFKDLDMTVLCAPLPLPLSLLSHDELDPSFWSTPQKTTGFIQMSARLHASLTASE